MAHKKGVGSSRNGRDSQSKRLGVKRFAGEVVNGEVNTHNVQAEMTRVDGVWKVSAARLLQRFEGVAGCALAS